MRFSIRSLLLLTLVLAASIAYLRRPTDLGIEYHTDVSRWLVDDERHLTIWGRVPIWENTDGVLYADTNADGIIDRRYEQDNDYAIASIDEDFDGVFDVEITLRTSNAVPIKESKISRPVPRTTREEKM